MLKRMNIIKSKKTSLDAFIDHSYFVSPKVVIAKGWVRTDSDSEIEMTVLAGDTILTANASTIIKFNRIDVNKHFNDDGETKSGVFIIIELDENLISDEVKSQISFKIEVGSTNKTVKSNITDNVSNVLNSMSLMASSEFQDVNEFLLKKYSSVIISTSDGQRVTPEELPEYLKINIENAFSIDGYGVFIQGWLLDSKELLAGLHIKQGASISSNLLDTSTSFFRSDVNEVFAQYVASTYKAGIYGLAKNQQFISGAVYELILVTKTGVISSQPLSVQTRSGDPVSLLKSILAPVDLNREGYQKELTGYLGDAITHIWKNKNLSSQKTEVKEYGTQVTQPECSLIIPIYGRYDFVLYQMTQFDKDEFMQKVEIIYVLDDPKIYAEFNAYCTTVKPFTKLSFKTVYGGSNRGYAGANNLGVENASSEMLLLLNSDVMPKSTGWLSDLLATYNSKDKIGILGARLLFEDETIQHDGLVYQKLPAFQDLWLIDHPGKGLPEWMCEGTEVRKIPSVTGACMLMSKKLYTELNGLDESYVLGDFEDSDLCLKALKSGYDNYIDSTTALYHLERQSQNLFSDTSWKFKLTIFNGIQHTQRWNSTITKLTKQGIK